MLNVDNSTPDNSWIPSTIIASILIIAIILLGWNISSDTRSGMLTEIIFALGIAMGWIIGTYLSPDSRGEARVFSDAFKGASIFITGFLASKLDKATEAFFRPENLLQNTVVSMRLIGFTAIVLFSAIGVYFIRKYGFGIGEKPSGESEKIANS
ncbi:MAG: hypothetical protein IPK50_12895 [Fibrobacterota bacterium]|nr:MAG: hypothetical protein IPK50_12895 [Fibrobacterota bacterium]